MFNKKSLTRLMGAAALITPLFVVAAPIPDEVTHFKIEQAGSLRVHNNVGKPSLTSTFDVNVSKDGKKWMISWSAPAQKGYPYKKEAKGEADVNMLENGAFELKGKSVEVTQMPDHKEVVQYEQYDKVFYPIENEKNHYIFIAHLKSDKGELITMGKAHFIFK